MPALPAMKMTGDRELRRKLQRMEFRVRNKIMKDALRKGAAPIRKEAARRAPRRTSNPPRKDGPPLHRTISIRSARKRKGHDEVSVRIGPTKKGAHAHLVEFGTAARFHKSGKYVGRMPAQPFLRPAFDLRKREAQQVARRELADKIEAEARRP